LSDTLNVIISTAYVIRRRSFHYLASLVHLLYAPAWNCLLTCERCKKQQNPNTQARCNLQDFVFQVLRSMNKATHTWLCLVCIFNFSCRIALTLLDAHIGTKQAGICLNVCNNKKLKLVLKYFMLKLIRIHLIILLANMRMYFYTFVNDSSISFQRNWTDKGCVLVSFERTAGVVTCQCHHLTNFAVLMSPSVQVSVILHVLKMMIVRL